MTNKLQSTMMNDIFFKLPFYFKTDKLLEVLNNINEKTWVSHPNKLAYTGTWEVLAFTSISGETTDIIAKENCKYYETNLLKKNSFIKTILNTFKTKVEAVRLMKLGANSTIKEHCDKGSCFEDGYARLHIPITSNDKVKFILNKHEYKMQIGNCYYINANKPHSVINKSNTSRVHLLIDCHVNEWLEKIFLNNGFKKTFYKYEDKNINDNNVDEIINSLKQLNTKTSLNMAKKLEKTRSSSEK